MDHFWRSHVYFLTDRKSAGYEVADDLTLREFLLSDVPVRARGIDGRYIRLSPERDMLNKIHQYGWPAAKLHYAFGAGAGLDGARCALQEGGIDPYFEEHAVRCYVENRFCGVAPEGEEGVTAALTLGIVERLDDAEILLGELSWKQWRALWVHGSTHGLGRVPPRVRVLTGDLLALARAGLSGRGAGEETFLDPLFDRWERRESPADRMTASFRACGVGQLADFGRTA
ncbi:hypothetical protein [Streptomyces sp. NPDC023327]|uniref:hypothetical protein n=1 Tax=Streptomyces sp. NPDC023327 TaxID=3157088 RepID=UPI0033D366E2